MSLLHSSDKLKGLELAQNEALGIGPVNVNAGHAFERGNDMTGTSAGATLTRYLP
jgi:hypothetical protein